MCVVEDQSRAAITYRYSLGGCAIRGRQGHRGATHTIGHTHSPDTLPLQGLPATCSLFSPLRYTTPFARGEASRTRSERSLHLQHLQSQPMTYAISGLLIRFRHNGHAVYGTAGRRHQRERVSSTKDPEHIEDWVG